MIKRDGQYCVCFESRLPKMGKASIRATSTAHIERFSENFEEWRRTKELPRGALIKLFREYGLDEHEIQIVFDRFYDDMSFADMVKKRGWVSTGTASYSYRKVLQKLKKRGFNFP